GSGKTTLRYTLEAECRSVRDPARRTLVVSYELSQKITRPPSIDEHRANLARELAVDLFIQLIEQLDTLDAPSGEQLQHLQGQMALVWPRLRQTVKRILGDDFSDSETGLAALWPRLNRPAVRYVHPSSRIIGLLKECMPPAALPTKTRTAPGEALLKAGLEAAKAWGFEQLFVLVDGVDAYERDVPHMLALISPLLEHLHNWQAEGLFFYFFLTSDMEAPLMKTHRASLRRLPFPPASYALTWEPQTLAELLHRRLRAAGSRDPGFNALATGGLENSLETRLIEAAQNSPRRLLHIVSALIDAHAQTDAGRVLITPADWRRMRANWSYGPPLPPKLTTNNRAA
ncbi:MAG: hypothetical protein ACE5G8_17240, partial [Anaerolineae bacterium]